MLGQFPSPLALNSASAPHRHSREDLCAPARRQREETGPQVSGGVDGGAAVAGHRHADPEHDARHYGRNQLRGSRGVPLFVQAQNAQHQHAGAHDLSEVRASTVERGCFNRVRTERSTDLVQETPAQGQEL